MPETIKGLDRVGVVATDPLRVLGLQDLLGRFGIEVVLLSVPRALDTAGVTITLIDSSVTTHLFELLEIFRKKRPALRLIVIGWEADHEYIERVIGAGAKGYLTHFSRESEIRMALEVVHDGSAWAPRKVMARLVELAREAQAAAKHAPSLTPREIEVLRLLILGQPNREIARRLGVQQPAIKAHVGRLMRKVGVANRTALTLQAIELGLDLTGSEASTSVNE